MRNYCTVDCRDTEWKPEDVVLNDGKIYHGYQCQSCRTICGQGDLVKMQTIFNRKQMLEGQL